MKEIAHLNTNMDTHCIPRCQCITLRGTQCTRAASIRDDVAFCHAHRTCSSNRLMSRKHSAQRTLAKVARGQKSRRETSKNRKAKVALTHLAEQTLRDLDALRSTPLPPTQKASPVHKTPRGVPPKSKTQRTSGRRRAPFAYSRPTAASKSR